MSLEATEAAAFAALQSALPAVLTAANATYLDGITVPPVATWKRGLTVVLQETTAAALPIIALGTYRETPKDPGDYAEWGSRVERPIVVAFAILGANEQEAHIRAVRLIDSVKATLRGTAYQQALSATAGALPSPWDFGAQWEAPLPFDATSGQWLVLGQVEVTNMECLELGG